MWVFGSERNAQSESVLPRLGRAERKERARKPGKGWHHTAPDPLYRRGDCDTRMHFHSPSPDCLFVNDTT